MKSLTVLFILVLTLLGCNCQKKAVENNVYSAEKLTTTPTLEYDETTRGSYLKISVTHNVALITEGRERTTREVILPEDVVKQIGIVYNMIDVKQLPNLKAPTEKRFYDGAPTAQFKVIFSKDNIVESAGFDGGYPPSEIETMVNQLRALIKL